MPLTDQNKAQLYSEAFAANLKLTQGEQVFQAIDLKTHLDVARQEIGVLNDELSAAKIQNEESGKAIDGLKAKLIEREELIEALKSRSVPMAPKRRR